MTVTTSASKRWDQTTSPVPFRPDRFPRRKVFGEIKPHNRAGISAGLAQLRTRRGLYPGSTPQLVTYRQVAGRPRHYEVLAADSGELREVLDRTRRGLRTWYRIGIVDYPRAMERIPRWECPSSFGTDIEDAVRSAYAAQVGVTLPAKRGNAPGADLVHEYAAFLRELAAELEGETYG
jgi:hypothetical protein